MSDNEEQKEMSGAQAFAAGSTILLLMGGFWFSNNEHAVRQFYFDNYEKIYLSLWAASAFVVFGVALWVKNKTKEVGDRAHLLYPLWDKEEDNILLGRTKDQIDLHLSDKDRCSHVQIIGATGRGKTESLVIPWAIRDLKRNKNVVLIDGKGTRDIPEKLRAWVSKAKLNARIIHFDLDNPDESIKINPLYRGTPQQITDRIFTAFEFEDPYYRSVQYDICGYLVQLIHKLGEDVTFERLHELLSEDKVLSTALQKLPSDSALKLKLIGFLKEAPNERRKKLAGLMSQLSPFAVGEVSKLVNGCDWCLDESLPESINTEPEKPFMFIFSIPTLKYQAIGHILGKLILQELAFAVGEREKLEDKTFTSVFLDEFSEFVYEGFISILNKARSANVALHLSHQAMSDLSMVSDDFARGVNTNTNVKCILGLNDPDTADFYARHLGTRTTDKLTEQLEGDGYWSVKTETGRASRREVESYKVHPNTLKELYQGQGVIHFPSSRGNVTEEISFVRLTDKEVSV